MKTPENLEIEWCSTEKIVKYSQNNRKHPESQVKRLAESIKQFGWTQPIVIDEDNVVLAGHGRLQAAQLLSLPQVPVLRRYTLNEDQKRAYRLIDNKLATEAPWDFGAVTGELAQLRDADYDLASWGLDELGRQIEAFMGGAGAALPSSSEPGSTDNGTAVGAGGVEHESISPQPTRHEISDADLARKREQLHDRFAKSATVRAVVCPGCGEEFDIDA